MKMKNSLLCGEKNVEILKQVFTNHINKFNKLSIDYISIVCENSLNEIVGTIDRKVLISTAVFLNQVRLIDNFVYSPST